MKAIGYIRVSTQEQATEGCSLQMQAEKIQSYCSLNDMELGEIIEDRGISAATTKRPGFQRIMGLAKTKKVDAIVVYKLDRLSRSVQDTLKLSSMLDKAGCALHSISEKLDTKSALGKFFFQMTASLAEMERNVISERTSAALQSKKARGEKTGGSVPYGFVAVKGILLADVKEQAILARIQELRAAGFSYQRISDALAVERIFNRKGNKLAKTQIIRIVKAAQNENH